MSKKELYHAVVEGNEGTVNDILINNPELINQIVMTRCTWLSIAADKGHLPVIENLVSNGANINICQDGVEEPLSMAAASGHMNIVIWLIEHGAQINPKNTSNNPIIGAIHYAHLEIVEYLISKGNLVNFTWGELKYSPISFAESFGESHKQILPILIEASNSECI